VSISGAYRAGGGDENSDSLFYSLNFWSRHPYFPRIPLAPPASGLYPERVDRIGVTIRGRSGMEKRTFDRADR